MKNLGKIIILVLLFVSSVNAAVRASLSPNDVFAGDATTYVLSISGSNVKKPIISDICGNQITATGSQTSIEPINGEYKKSYSLSYQFTPRKSCTIDAIAVEIDGKIEHSNSIDVNVLPRVKNLNADFILEFESWAKELYVGEPFSVTLLLKQKRGAQIVDSKFIAPAFKGFWIKSEMKPQRTQDSEYMTTKLVYELAPQREGNISLGVAELKIATRVGSNNWGTLIPQVRWHTYYSNEVSIEVKALPQNVTIVGNFTIKASVQKQEINPNEAVNVTLEIKGSGNFEDIESFKPFISDINVFDEKIQLLKGGLSQKIVFVSEQDFTIPSFALKYFDINTKEVRTIQTEPIEIKVKGNIAKKEVSITRNEVSLVKTVETDKRVVIEKNNYFYISFAFILGLVIGIIGMFLKSKKTSKKFKVSDIKDEKVLLIKLLPFKDSDKDVEELVRVLENNVYSKEKISLDKKRLKEVLKKYDIF